MAKSGGVADFNTFVKGIITEASPLTYPENASLDEANFELLRNGSRRRRLGMDLEPLHYTAQATGMNYLDDSHGVNVYLWEAAGNKGGNNFIVTQVGTDIQFFAQDRDAASAHPIDAATIRLTNFAAIPEYQTLIKDARVTFGNIKGYLLITGEYIDPIYCTFDPDSGTISSNKITIEIRDFLGLEDGFPVDYRPNTTEMNNRHQYNLKNQGWTDSNIASFFTSESVYPSNADIQYLGKDSTGAFTAAQLKQQFFGNTPAPKGAFKYNIFDRQYRDYEYDIVNAITNITYDDANNVMEITTSAGHGLVAGQDILLRGIKQTVTYTVTGPKFTRNITRDIPPELDILNNKHFDVATIVSTTVFRINVNIDLSSEYTFANNDGSSGARGYAASGGSVVSYTPADVIEEFQEFRRFTAIAGYASRAWYSGINGGDYSNYVFYSQILEKPEQIGYCYQDADPTSEHVSDLVETDGGVIIIPEMNLCLALTPMGSNLFVFANNGVWRISGIDGTFTATSYKVEKVSSVGVEGQMTIVPTENMIYYFAKGGIYRILQDTVQGNYYSENISETTIQSLFNEIPKEAKDYIRGTYDPSSKIVEWMYMNDEDYLATDKSRYCYNTFLRFDTVLQSFYLYSLPLGNNWTDQYGNTLTGVGTSTVLGMRLIPYVTGSIVTPEVITLDDPQEVLSDGVPVESDGVEVRVTSTLRRSGLTQVKYMVMNPYSFGFTGSGPWTLTSVTAGITFGQMYRDSFYDWESAQYLEGTYEDYESYLITGAQMYGTQSQKKQAPYVLFYFNRTDGPLYEDVTGQVTNTKPSSCLVRAMWDWSNDPISGKWSTEFQAYRIQRPWYATEGLDPYNYGQDVVITKSKIRGRGRSLSLYIKSESGKDMQLNGWTTVVSANQKP